ncbi:unnamed protein product [marine sediment metagenome]|uniref:Uncharacterized protein n=1 Tax=marine sediment metagenome TaxID=412755 RepID=X1BU89_9ZZZZ
MFSAKKGVEFLNFTSLLPLKNNVARYNLKNEYSRITVNFSNPKSNFLTILDALHFLHQQI